MRILALAVRRQAGSLRAFRAVLGSRALRRIELAFAGFNTAEHAMWVAILVFAYGRGGATEAGIVALVQLGPAAIVAPLAALLGDRYPRDRVLAAAYLVQCLSAGATAVALLLDLAAPLVYTAAIAAAVSIVLTRPAQSSLLPSLARTPDELTAANVASGTIENASILVGPVLAGFLLPVAGPGSVYLVAALALGIGFALVARVRVDEGDRQAAEATGSPDQTDTAADALRQALDGFRVLAAQPAPRSIVGALALAWVLWGAIDVFAVMLAIDLLGLGEQGAGFLSSAVGAGGLLGSLAAVLLVGRGRLVPPLLLGLVLWGAPLAVLGVVPQPLLAFALIGLAGAGRSVLDVAGRTLLQRIADDDVLARLFGVLEGFQVGALAVGSVTAPLLVAAAGQRGALVVAGLVLPIVAVAVRGRLAGLEAGTPVPHDRLALLTGIPMFAPLSPPTLERLVRHLVPVTVPAGTWVIRAGERGDRFYVVAAGVAEVLIGGEAIRREVAGDSFGEIALLRDVPRTASVRALTELHLLALERDPFLAAITGQPRSRHVAEAIVADRLGAGA